MTNGFGSHLYSSHTFTSGGITYRLAGMSPRRSKNNMLIERQSDMSMRVTSEEQVVLHFTAKARKAA